jgi:hypothetical protein
VSGERLYRGAVLSFSIAFVAIGVLVLAITLVNGGGPTSLGFVMGVAFLVVGVGRIWVGSRTGG